MPGKAIQVLMSSTWLRWQKKRKSPSGRHKTQGEIPWAEAQLAGRGVREGQWPKCRTGLSPLCGAKNRGVQPAWSRSWLWKHLHPPGKYAPEEFVHPRKEVRSSFVYPLPALGETMLLTPILSEQVVYGRKVVPGSLVWEHRMWETDTRQASQASGDTDGHLAKERAKRPRIHTIRIPGQGSVRLIIQNYRRCEKTSLQEQGAAHSKSGSESQHFQKEIVTQ